MLDIISGIGARMCLTCALKFSLYVMKLEASQLLKNALNNISEYNIWLLEVSLTIENLFSLKDKMSGSKMKETKSEQIRICSPSREMISLCSLL